LSDSRIHEFNQRSFIPLCVSTLRVIFHSWKCDVYQFSFHLLLCFHFLVLNNFSNFFLVSIPTMIDQSNESNPVDSHHLVFRAWQSRFRIGKEVYYTKCLTEGQPCFSCIRLRKRKQCCEPMIGGETSVTSNLSSGSSMDQIQYMTIRERSIMWYCSHGLLSSSFGMGMASF